MPADVLSDRSPVPPPPPDAPEAAPKAETPSLAGYAKIYQDEIAKLTPKYEAAEKAAKEDVERRRGELAEFKQRALTAPGPPVPPTLPVEPPAPKIQARPFLDIGPGDDWKSSLQKLSLGMGLMAQMAVGIKGGFPQGALAAYTGALSGWSEGDHIRAANEWKTYMGQLQQYDRSVSRVQQQFENTMKTWGHDQERLKTEMGILAAEHGLSREGIELAFREPDRLLQQVTTSAKIMETMVRDSENAAHRNMMGLATITRDREMAQYHRELIELKKKEAATTASSGLTPDALESEARKYLAGAGLTSFGLGKSGAAVKQSIINRATAIAKSEGMGVGDQATRQALYKANQTELNAIQRQRGPVLAFARNFDRAIDLALEMSEKTDRGGATVFNKWLLAGRKATGDVDVARFHAALLTGSTEYARVMSGGTVSTDTARAEAGNILSGFFTKEQFRGVVDIMKRDTANRIKGYDDQLQAVRQSMQQFGKEGEAAMHMADDDAMDRELGIK